MKLLPRLGFFIFLLAFAAADAAAQTPCSLGTEYKGCRACGTAQGVKAQRLNVQKNRDEKATNPEKITLKEMRNPSNNKGHFSPDRPVFVTGYVASVVSGGNQESCNCGRADLRDIHINIVAQPSEVGNLSKYVVVEFTPRWEQTLNLSESDYQKMLKKVRKRLVNKWVRFEGWMLYDYMHEDASKTVQPGQKTCPDDGKNHPNCNWRATPWEVHPITAFEIVTGPDN